MRDFSQGVQLGASEDEYQRALADHADGIVVNLGRDRTGRFTLHSARCRTLCYDLRGKGQRFRSGKYIFADQHELTAKAEKLSIDVGALNRCSRCMQSQV